jgi:squalene-hopene/tetraprenyl-beta-curcumene cyclase
MSAPKFALALLTGAAFTAGALADPVLKDPKNLSLRNEVQTAIDRGLAWLQAGQKEDGSWSNSDHPALTAMPVLAFQRAPGGNHVKQPPEFLKKAYAWMRAQAKPDGGIYNKGLSNYNTSVAMMALLASGEPGDEPIIEAARRFVGRQQASGMTKPELDGGFGYGPTGASPKRQHPDLDNTVVSLEAIRTYEAARPAGELKSADDLNWEAARAFISRTQNHPPTNPESWASADPENAGGFIYYPGFSNAGEQELPDGRKAWRSYGTMTYAGMLSLLYAEVAKEDPRVKAALGWLERNYTLDENPGMDHQGLYYYYHLMAKSLTAAGVSHLQLSDGRKIDWRRELATKLINLQKGDGHWLNTTGRWMENDPILVTSYCVLALEMLYPQL